MEIRKNDTGFDGYTNKTKELIVTTCIKENIVEVRIEGKMVTPAVPTLTQLFTENLSRKNGIDLDLSKTRFLCVEAIAAMVGAARVADINDLHFFIKAISSAAYENIRTVSYISRVLSGNWEPVSLPPSEPPEIPEEPNEPDEPFDSAPETNPIIEPIPTPPQNAIDLSPSKKSTRLLTSTSSMINELKKTKRLENTTVVPVLIHLPTGIIYRGEHYKTTIGRSEVCDICLPDELECISRIHAHIVQFDGGRYLVADKDARNETLVNGVELDVSQPALLSNDNWVQLATEPFFLAFVSSDKPLPLSVSYLVHEETNEYRHLKNDDFLLGRENSWRIMTEKMDYIGRRHAMIVYRNGCYYLRDNHSQNKSYLNGEELIPDKEYLLNDQAKITLGISTFVFRTFSLSVEEQKQ